LKFWVKIFIGTMFVFTFAFAVGAIFLSSSAFNFNRRREIENGVREQSVILSSVENRINTIEQIYPDVTMNKERLAAIVKPLSDYYKMQNVLLALYCNGEEVYSDIPNAEFAELLEFEALPKNKNKKYTDIVSDEKRYLLVSSPVGGDSNLIFVYARDISELDNFRKEISRSFQITSAVVLLSLGLLIYLMLRHFTRPIASLNKITAQIAKGDYGKRVDANRNDEFGALAQNFNTMADSVEENIQRLTRAAEDRQQFIDNLSHEMKTPLTAISGYAEYLRNARCNEEERITAAEHLYNMSLRLENLSKKLLDMAFMREKAIEKKPCDSGKLLRELAEMTSPLLSSRNQKLVIHNNTKFIDGDETLLLSMLANLVENAARASDPKSVITVKADDAAIEVIDTGRGIAPEEIEKITEPFYRVDASRSRKFGGVGLGLSIVSQIAELHGAKLEIESEPNKGTSVKIIFS